MAGDPPAASDVVRDPPTASAMAGDPPREPPGAKLDLTGKFVMG